MRRYLDCSWVVIVGRGSESLVILVAMPSLRDHLLDTVLLADGAMGTMLQAVELTLDDFEGFEGCNEILNRTRPDVVAGVHRAYFEAGSDMVTTNTFGANLAALGEYGIPDQIEDLALRGAQIAREVADEYSTPQWPCFVLGSVGPGTKLPTLGHIEATELRDAYQRQVAAMIRGGIDAVQIETCQDLQQAKAAVIGAKRARTAAGVDLPILVSVTVETTGVMLLGSEIGAALTTLAPLGVDMIGLNCATGPAEMGEHLRYLARNARIGISVMPNAGLPELGPNGAVYPLTPQELADALDEFVTVHGVSLVGGCCGTTPDHIRAVREMLGRDRAVVARETDPGNALASLYAEVPFAQDASYLAIGERTNANGSKAFREAMLAGSLDECVDIARAQSSSGAHVLDLCVDYVGRDGTVDMTALSKLFATSVTLPVMIDSTEPEVIEAGLNHLPGRSIINSVNFEDGDGPDSRFQRVMPIVREHGAAVVALTIDEEGQARTAEWKVRVAERLIQALTGQWGMDEGDIMVDCLTFPIATGAEETRRDGVATIDAIRALKAAHPRVLTTLGVSNVSFGLNPAARIVLNSVFLDECIKAGLDSAIVSVARIMPVSRIPEEQYRVALDLIYDHRRDGYDPLQVFLSMFEGISTASLKQQREAEMAALPVAERLARRIIDGNDKALADDLDEALASKSALEIINDDLLSGMKTVGELFGSGKMQLPFVLQSAEVMKKAVAHLEPHMDSSLAGAGKGTLVLATVKGDVHDIGKNLVDIIVSNNGYSVVNIGIKQPITAIVEAAEQHDADAIGMSGLLVKSTVVMKDNLVELNERGLAGKYPVMLGGAALTRPYVDNDLAELYDGEVRYAKDAFEGLALMDAIMAVKQGVPGARLPARRQRRVAPRTHDLPDLADTSVRSQVDRGVPVPIPPFWGTRVSKGIGLAEVVSWLDRKALFKGRWGLRAVPDGPSYEEIIATEAEPRLRGLLDRIQAEGLGEFAAVHGYFPCFSRGNTLVVLDPEDHTSVRACFDFPRQPSGKRLCLADYFRDEQETADLGPDVLGMQLVTMGSKVSQTTAELYALNSYREYLELHGLSVQLAEATAELIHHRIRAELGFADQDGPVAEQLEHQAYRGSRYSFGYPACPDLEMRAQLCELLAPARIGVHLSEEFQLDPEQSTDAIVIHHPQAKYFSTR